jgi:hypothetical protein
MKRYTNAVAIITLVILLPMVGASLWTFIAGKLTFAEFSAGWKEPMLLLIGFWIRGAASQDSQKSE